jgi:hypothetical protein
MATRQWRKKQAQRSASVRIVRVGHAADGLAVAEAEAASDICSGDE